MSPADYKFFEEMLKRESGLSLTPEKVYLLETRLMPIAQKHRLSGLEELVQKLQSSQDVSLRTAVVEAMTTNETMFFRDTAPFQRLKDDLLPFYIKARSAQKQLRIWSAACSSGQEPYSIAMLLKEYPALAGWKCEIVATDISTDILDQARAATYSQFHVQRGLPIQMLVKYFTKNEDCWTIRPEIREMVHFRQANLLTDLSGLGQFDIIFCRNVLIYFDLPTKAKVLAGIRSLTKKDSVLLLGGAETVLGISENFKPLPNIKAVYARHDTTFGQ